MPAVRLVVFDLDGVIVDTARFHFLAWKELLWERWGVRHVPRVDELTKGVGRYECLRLILREYGLQLPEEEVVAVGDEKNRRYVQLLETQLDESCILPGVRSALALLKRRRIPIALASSSYNAPYVLEKLRLSFDYVADPSSVARGKPAPDLYLACAAHFGIPPEHCLGVEDARSGVASVRAAGMLCLGVGDWEALGESHRVIPSTSQLPLALEELLEPCPSATLPWSAGFALPFDLRSGLCGEGSPTQRHIGDMAGFYLDRAAEAQLVQKGNPLVYAFYELNPPSHPGDLAFGTTILLPGAVGNEYFMTKGHFHQVADTGEIYYGLAGQGLLVMESAQGDCAQLPVEPGRAVYVPKGYAHRLVNTGTEELVCFFAFRADAGHDYQSIATSGFRKLVLKGDSGPVVADNPRWNTGKELET